MITKEFAEASSEINEILGYLPNEYVEKIPVKLREFFKKVADKDYVSNIDPYKTLDQQKMKLKTKTLLTIIYREYWCNSEERVELDKILIENDRRHEGDIRKKYNTDNIFKQKEIPQKIEEAGKNNLINYDNRAWFQKAFDFVSNIFKKIFKK